MWMNSKLEIDYINHLVPTISSPQPEMIPPDWNYFSTCLPDGKQGLFFQKDGLDKISLVRTYILGHYISNVLGRSENSIAIFLPEESKRVALFNLKKNSMPVDKMCSLARSFMMKISKIFQGKKQIPIEEIIQIRNDSRLFGSLELWR